MATLRKNADERQCSAPSSSGAAGFLSESSAGLRDTPNAYRVSGGTEPEPPSGEIFASAAAGEATPANQSRRRRLRACALRCTEQPDVQEPAGHATQDLFRRVGYHDLRAYSQLVDGGLHQGFVLVRHHTLVGTVQKVFRAGAAQPKSALALELALAQLDRLAYTLAQEGLALDCGEQSI